MSKGIKILLCILVPLIFIAAVAGVVYNSNTAEKTDYSTVVQMFYNDQVSEAELNMYNGTLKYVTRADGKTHTLTVVSEVFYSDLRDIIREKNTDDTAENDIIVNYEAGGETSWLMSLLPTLIMIAITIFAFVFIMKKMNAGMGGDKTMSFGMARI